MKVFFIAPPRGISSLGQEYRLIYKTIEDLGHSNVSDIAIKAKPGDYSQLSYDKISGYYTDRYKKILNNIKKADVVLIEGSIPSLTMGYLVDKSLELNKPVLVMHVAQKAPFFLMAIEDEKVQIVEYDKARLKPILKTALSYATEQLDTRFNFFVSPKISNYLDWVCKHKKTPRAVYLRNLIEEKMKQDKEYNQD